METKSLLFGLIGFFLGGLIVSIAATTFDKPADTATMSEMTARLKALRGDEFDKAYLANMIEHHQSAVDMSKLAGERSAHAEIKTLSTEIISEQQKEIGMMKSWQTTWGYETDVQSHRGY